MRFMMVVINLVYHHGGQLVTKEDGEMVYEMGEIDIVECWWLVPGRPLRSGRRVLDTDDKLLELCFYAERNGNKIHLYYEHAVSVPNLVKDCPKLIEMTPTPTQVQAEAPTVIDLDIPPQEDIPLKSTPPTQAHANTTENSNSKIANNDNTNPTKSNINYGKPRNSKPTNSMPSNTKTAKPTDKPTSKSTTKPTPKPNSVRPQTRSTTKVSLGRAKKFVQTPISGDEGSSSSDSYDSVEDNLYMPRPDELFSEDEDEDEIRITQARKKDSKRKHGANVDLKKAREDIMLEDDGLVVDSDSDVEFGHVFANDANVSGGCETYDAYDADSDGKESWESLEMKTPPNSEGDDNVAYDDTPLFKEWSNLER
ncbi:hypothetical protein PIB30_078865 [Stylosanthes scabra]|uniref:PB1-like domain-containing protein n=1 Tax=Stylosanthes scabra TaxID=79078 RepID=A0ABU6RS40_9FABA|nr:hypothetical protein [Stylosanthes scabra]